MFDIGTLNYTFVVGLMMIGLFIVIASNNFVKKIIGLNIFQTSVFILYISFAKVREATAPILSDHFDTYSNPLPHVLILTAIVVGVATTAVGLALIVRIRSAFGTIDDRDVMEVDEDTT